jgi:release factor glutamine methyltransferase
VNRQPPPPATVGAALQWARRQIRPPEFGALEAQVLLSRLLRRPRSWILAHPETDLPPGSFAEFSACFRRAADGEPLAYLTGSREFFGWSFEVDPDVLVPRPETELLVEMALGWLGNARQNRTRRRRELRVVDLGTGSGCIAAALALRRPGLRVIATDISFPALAVAARNLAALGVADRVSLIQADLLSPWRGPIDLLCANLPYIPTAELNSLPILRYEPRLALDGGPDGLRLIARALAQCDALLDEGGLALFEIEGSQGGAAPALAREIFPASSVGVKKDAAGHDRLLYVLR